MTPTFIDHIVFLVKDILETEKFYSTFLGTPAYLEKEQVVYKVGDTKMFFVLADGEWQTIDKDRGGLNHFAFGVKTVDELGAFERILHENHIKNSGIRIDKYGKKEFIWFDDPNGIRLEFYCRGNE